MDIQGVSSIVGTVGFPIVCCLCMMYYVREQQQENRQQIEELNNKYDENIKTLTETINNNTLALQKLSDKLDCKSLKGE